MPHRTALGTGLSEEAAQEVLEHLAHLGAARLPLAEGLHAAARESDQPNTARTLRALAAQLEQGRSLSQALETSPALLPEHQAGLVLAALQTGDWGLTLLDLLDQQRAARLLRTGIWSGFAYSLVVLWLSAMLVLAVLFWITPMFERIFQEFGLQLPALTLFLFWWRNVGVWCLLAVAIVLLLLALAYRRWAGAVAWYRLLASMPLLGPLVQLSALTDWAGVLAVLLRHHLRLPDALRLTATGLSNAHLAQLSRRLAEGVEQGRPLSSLIAANRAFPHALTPLFAWGEQANSLADALWGGREMLARRLELRAGVLHAILPPLTLMAIGSMVLLLAGGLFMPMFTLITGLS